MSDFLCIFAAEYVLTTFDNVSKCGEIWLLATTLKNAKILTWVTVQRCPPDISMFLCFCDRSAFLWGFFVAWTKLTPVRKNGPKSGRDRKKI